jgi:predicted lipoprotein with Yx(FWY)xxD motif
MDHAGTGTVVKRLAGFAALALVLAACAKSSPTGSAPTSPTAASSSATMSIATDQVKGLGTVLDTSAGLTLYHNTQESHGMIVCTGACAGTWPPLLVSGAVPSTPTGTTGAFGTITRPDGTKQLTLNGMPLYTYAGDSAAGQATGQGLGGVWFAVGPSGAITTSSGSSGSSSGSSGGGNTGW